MQNDGNDDGEMPELGSALSFHWTYLVGVTPSIKLARPHALGKVKGVEQQPDDISDDAQAEWSWH
jgi:hypothetical protein